MTARSVGKCVISKAFGLFGAFSSNLNVSRVSSDKLRQVPQRFFTMDREFRDMDRKLLMKTVTATSPDQKCPFSSDSSSESDVPEESPMKIKLVTEEEAEEFEYLFPILASDVVEMVSKDAFNSWLEVKDRFTMCMLHTVPNGKKNRGLAVVASYKILEKPENLTKHNVKLANILGWTVEILQAFFLVMDDITDGSELRRGKPCWYKKPNIGMGAINDGLLLENSVYMLLQKYFKLHPSYIYLMESFLEATRKTTLGQILDCNTVPVPLIRMERMKQIAYFKTAYYSFYLPVSLALYLAGYKDPAIHNQVKTVLLEMGLYFQVQDDYLDCYGDPKVTGKIGTDIETGKCTWLAATAMEIGTPQQKAIMKKHYGKNVPESVQKIKDMYNKLDMPKLYGDFETTSHFGLKTMIEEMPKGGTQELMHKLLAVIYKRNA